ncbi:FAD-binding protein [Streptomyces sp. SID13031]|nr:FAD-binding protein [Streptomyces sp. SID13031]
MKRRGYFAVGVLTTWNVLLYAVTGGRYIWLEGRVTGGVFRNWLRRFRYRPQRVARPASEQEIVELVKAGGQVRVFGAGHSFNSGIETTGTLISLDSYRGVVAKDLAKKQVTFKGGTRVREIAKTLLADGLAFASLPSHDAQSIAGILSTDVHGTGRDWGFVSELVTGLKLVDGNGIVHECVPGDELFAAAVGGIGAVGIIIEATVQAVDRFNVEQRVELSELPLVEANLGTLLQQHAHLSLYLFPFTDRCQLNTWQPTAKKQSFLGDFREAVTISFDALTAAWFAGLLAKTGLLPKVSRAAHRLKRGSNLVLESNRAYNRSIYHLHQELEFAIPYEDAMPVARRFLELYESMYSGDLPYTFVEVRFTPAGHERTLLGAGRDRHSVWLDLLCNDSHAFEQYYAAAEALMREIGARPHLGKYSRSITGADLAAALGPRYTRFLELKAQHDPAGKFDNDFTKRLLQQ